MTAANTVLIIGGGPVGLALALDLGLRGVPSTVVDRSPDLSGEFVPKATVLNERSMEYFRSLGIARQVAEAGFPPERPRDTYYCTSMNGFVCGRDPVPAYRERGTEYSAEVLCSCPQYTFTPILAAAAGKTGLVDFRLGSEFTAITEHDREAVTAVVRARDGSRDTIRARYLVGADGVGSAVRRSAGIPFEGEDLDYSVSLTIRVEDFERYHPMGPGERYMFLDTTGVWGNLTAMDGRSIYRLTLIGAESRLNPDELDPAAHLERAFGRADVPWELLKVVPWRRSRYTARAFRSGRVLLAGDSAHTMSPTGGHGANTGLLDAAGLGWVLAARLPGWGGETLLDAYSAERREVALRNGAYSSANYTVWSQPMRYEHIHEDSAGGERERAQAATRLSGKLEQEWFSRGVALGYRYRDSPVILDDGSPEPPDEASEYTPSARPGHRAPHAWLPDGRSVLDLFGDGFTLLRFDTSVSTTALPGSGLPVQVIDIGEESIAARYEHALVLIRPDGIVAWRGDALPPDTVRGATDSGGDR
ncbi:FAD-dependent monooxygenase [Sciscionella marina]|uniref:FAD-dependent monooxygenase n=1 Tax=Sciscionella marina TaxID=508770 RepID=UPI0003749D61|nr:FAD-dependent monooxygenase [Sciscionella marina]